jgi:hypothetical protein
VITRAEADRLFDADAVKYETAVSLATPNATQEQFDAMTSLAYNIGTAGFAKSTVAARHNMGDFEGAAAAFLMWNKSQGKVLPVLERRRAQEAGVYLNGYAGAPYSQPPVSGPSVAAEPIAWSVPSAPAPAAAGAALAAVAVAAGVVFFCPACSVKLVVVAEGS